MFEKTMMAAVLLSACACKTTDKAKPVAPAVGKNSCIAASKEFIPYFQNVDKEAPVFAPCNGIVDDIAQAVLNPKLEVFFISCNDVPWKFQIYYLSRAGGMEPGIRVEKGDIIGRAGKHLPEHAKSADSEYYIVTEIKDTERNLWLDPKDVFFLNDKNCSEEQKNAKSDTPSDYNIGQPIPPSAVDSSSAY